MPLTRAVLICLKVFCFFIGSMLTFCASAQTCTPIYNKTYNGSGNDEALDIVVTPDGGSIVAGRTTSNSLLWDGFLLKLNAQGDISWARSYGGNQYDDLVKVKPTNDGGFIAVGTTKSFGASSGEAWLLKTDAGGNQLWSRHIDYNGQAIKARRIIALSTGGYAIALNSNDSSTTGNGIVIITDGSGNIAWTKIFDNGRDDGINYLYEDGTTLLVGGYATVTDRDGILMRLDIGTGVVLWAKKFARQGGLSDEIIEVEKRQGGLAFGASSTWTKSSNGYNPFFLTLFKTRGDDSVISQRRVELTSGSGYTLQNVELRSTADSGFIFAMNDTTPTGWSSFRKISPAGLADWGRVQPQFGNHRLKALDLYGGKGYVLAGYLSSSLTGNRNQIQVLKTDFTGNTGACSGDLAGNFTDTTFYQVGPFTWNTITSAGVSDGGISPTTSALNYTVNTLCSDKYCSDPDPSVDTSCYATFLTHLKQNNYSFVAYDMIKVPDGYIAFGYNRLFWNIEPVMIKVRSDGTVAWSKTLTTFMHQQTFNQVLLTDDGNLLIVGKDDFTINHGASSGSFFVKITTAGNVLWAKYVSGEVYDIRAGDSGGFVGAFVTKYGFPPTYVTLFKMDAAGTIVWQKQLSKNYEIHSIFRRIAYDGKYIYAAGEYYNQNPQSIAIDKIDSSGNRIWSKSFRVNGFSTSVEALDIIGDSVYLTTNFFDNTANPNAAKKKLASIKMAKDGSGISGFALDKLDLIYDSRIYAWANSLFHTVTKTYDNQFIVADRAGGAADSSVVLTKFSTSGNIAWSRRYDNLKGHFVSMIKDDNGSLLVLGRKYTGTVDQTYMFENLLMRADNNGIVALNGTGFCHSVPNAVSTIPVTLVDAFSYTSGPINGEITSTSYMPIERTYTINASVGCGVQANCSSIKIVGPRTLCTAGDTITYTTTRNPGCNIPSIWLYDSARINVIKTTDTSLTVRFKISGITTIKASLQSSCGQITDSIQPDVRFSGKLLSLGPDTVICPGNTIALNARKGYDSYLWQDGSTDSILAATVAGLFYVTVRDGCGRSYSDSIHVSPHPVISLNVSPDRTKCNSDTIQFAAPPGFMNYTWSPGYNLNSISLANVVANPSIDTTYYLKAEESPGCFAYDTIRVTVNHSPIINLGSDVSFCSGDTITLNAGTGFSSYKWNMISGSQYKTVFAPGLYSVIGTTAQGCTSRDTFAVSNVWSIPTVALDKNTELCAQTTRTLSAGNFSSYLWQDGSIGSKYTVNGLGHYWVQVKDSHACIGSDSVTITSVLPLPERFLPQDTAICAYGTLLLKPKQNYSSYLWNNGSTSPTLLVDKPGTYWLQVRNEKSCAGSDSMVVNSKQCVTDVYFTTAFSPNQDSKNDAFKALVFGTLKTFELTIYNRWGQMVFHTKDPSKGWDGKAGGIDQTSGAYVWTSRYQLVGGSERIETGTVTLIR